MPESGTAKHRRRRVKKTKSRSSNTVESKPADMAPCCGAEAKAFDHAPVSNIGATLANVGAPPCNINQMWSRHCKAGTSAELYTGSLLCDLGFGSPTARLLASVRLVPQVSRDKRGDIIVTLLNHALYLIMNEAEYLQVEIDDLQAMQPLNEAEKQQVDALYARRSLIVDAEKKSILLQVAEDIEEEVVDGFITKIKALKQERCSGVVFSFKDLDWIFDFFQNHATISEFIRGALNDKLQGYGIAVPSVLP
jgi:hypothetical protein